MRCHYEVLNVSKEAEDSEIKSSYRKLALKWHPDKNLDDSDNAKEQFQLIQQAYEVLSDKQERAWYDRHREQILLGAQSDFEDKNLNVFQYFTTSCFRGYGDDENGFYTVYRNVFEQIAMEDLDYFENKEDFVDIPSFGTSESDFDTVVNLFYSHWLSYSTKKSYVWLDPYKIAEIKDRRYVKAVEKENKKVRSKAKKERNEEIRNLVAFVRKRDKRVQAQIKLNLEKNEANRKKHDELRRQKLEENRKMNESQVQPEWTKFENMTSELQEIEKNLDNEFGNSDCSDDEIYNKHYCPACDKFFKTKKTFQNHESSMKHKLNVAALRAEMLGSDEEEDDDLEVDVKNSEDNLDDMDSELSSGKRQTNQGEEESDAYEKDVDAVIPKKKKTQKTKFSASHHYMSPDTDSEELPLNNGHKKPNKAKKNKNVLKVESTDDELKMSTLPASSSSDDDFSSSKKGKKKKKKNKPKKTQPVVNTKEEPSSETLLFTENTSNSNTSKDDLPNFICSTCSKNYPSKNKLFMHLKAEGHGAPLPLNTSGATSKGRAKGKASRK